MAVRLTCNVNNYHWGKHGFSSKAAQFASINPELTIDPKQTYSELWMGTHPNGPSILYGTEKELSKLIEEEPKVLGDRIIKKYGGLPFLFKVLSIEKALSIQAHPDKILAKKLHIERPQIYKDDNHKPEMSIALTDFIAMSGFRPLEHISTYLDEYPEFQALISKDTITTFKNSIKKDDTIGRKALKELFSELMNATEKDVQIQLDKLLERIGQNNDEPLDITETALIRRLSSEYPGDIGVFCVFMLNVLKLKPGEAFFMGPNDPHAYIFGDCIECMATSDNVVRAGLTPKLRDVPVLVDMLSYDYGTPDSKILRPIKSNSASLLYDPPIEEFSVLQTNLLAKQTENILTPIGPKILIVTEGIGELTVAGVLHKVQPGSVYFVPTELSITLTASDHPMVVYTALCMA
ncbi:mannose-6-phosphate isomerase [Coemansia reversa NRRL 1564]|uniref:Mannose-6-phosphate isomerase n=1 Tax=Coemansia reversa (strain ATCC 12441 / NRRL 1564) TaxID=763665 RepID=A0A2G5B523_COERN|nr:mannose-6-phosphate isomerase [Coemansia reversa NRRL 1564]|eukprot:PIA14092.1 mannose-6-phosphate isomerase [Coemansia reversa NRRL 1564]